MSQGTQHCVRVGVNGIDMSCANGQVGIVKVLVENGANVNVKNDSDNTPLRKV